MYSKADTHIHTSYSDGLMSPQEAVDFVARHTDLRVIAVTDHDTTEGAFMAQSYAQRRVPHLEVIIGQEITTDEGDMIGLFLKSTLPAFETVAEAIEAVHAQAGLAVAVHPFSRWVTFNTMYGVGTKIFDHLFDAVEIRNGFPANLISNPLTAWFNRYLGQQLAEVGGSDSHVPFTIGQPFTRFPGRAASDLRRAIERSTVRAGGLCWTPSSLACLIPMLIKHGRPRRQQGVEL